MASHNNSLAAHHNFIRGWVGYLANWQNPFCQILSRTTATLHLHNKQQTQMALDSKLRCEFL